MTETRLGLGILAYRDGRLADAEHHLRAALDEPGAKLLAARNLGTVLLQLGRPAEALEPLRLATTLQPAMPEHWSILGSAASSAEEYTLAVQAYRELLRLIPPNAKVQRLLGEALFHLNDIVSAESVLTQAEAMEADGIARMLLGHCARRQADYPRAIALYRSALGMLPPDSVAARTARWMMGIALLHLGDFDHGWAAFEARLTLPPLSIPHARWTAQMPEWDGTLIPGMRLIVHYEQGFGDTLHFVRYLPILRAQGLHVTLVAQAPLIRLLRRQGTALADAIVEETAVPRGDAHVWLMSVPDRLRPILKGDIPTATPYLTANCAAIERARSRLTQASGGLPAIGVVWAGNPRHSRDHARSIPYARLSPLLDQRSVRFFSFQMGAARDEFRARPHPNLIDATEGLADFDDTAAAFSALDGLITVDSAPAHLAGALHIPTAMLVGRNHDWRWGGAHLIRSPWYPGMVLYRQAADESWDPELEHLGQRLASGSAFFNQF